MINKQEVELLDNLFESKLDNLDLEQNKNLFETVTFKMGEIIISPNKISKDLFFLISGQLRMRSLPDETNKTITLGLEEEPTIFGNLSDRYKESIEFISASTECCLD